MKNDIFILCVLDKHKVRRLRGLAGAMLGRPLLSLGGYVIMQGDTLISFGFTMNTFLLDVVAGAAPLAVVGAGGRKLLRCAICSAASLTHIYIFYSQDD